MPLGERVGAKLSIPVTFWSALGESTALTFTPWYELFRIGQGEGRPLRTLAGDLIPGNLPGTYEGALEPASAAHNYGLQVSAKFSLK